MEESNTECNSDSNRVITAVRIRPVFLQELEQNCHVIATTSIIDGEVNIVNPTFFDSRNPNDRLRKLEERKFVFDHSFWSVEEKHPDYCTQEHVYNKIGKPIVKKALSGLNCSLFAYGQTGSGKTYTMMGQIEVADTAGIIPRLCRDIFVVIQASKGRVAAKCRGGGGDSISESPVDGGSVGVEGAGSSLIMDAELRVAYFEVYNERIYDLLAADPSAACKVREHPQSGAFVEGLVQRPVLNYENVHDVLSEGHSKRAVAETAMNAESSRSHAVFTLYIRQKILLDSDGVDLDSIDSSSLPIVERKSKVCLIDLAGSERLKSTLATGERLQEATNINRSLFALGDVIKALSESVREDRYIPYRNSILTWILKDSLGGNSRTSILATISPIDRSHSETLNTLGYVERAKLIVNKAVVNEDKSGNPFIKHLQQQIALYKAKLTDALSKLRKSDSDLKALQIEWDMRHGGSSDARGLFSWEDSAAGRTTGDGSAGMITEVDENGLLLPGNSYSPEMRNLREALAASVMEYNELNQRLVEMEDLHRIDMEFYQDRLKAAEGGEGSGGDGTAPSARRQSAGGDSENVQKLNSIVESLQLRLQTKDNDMFALKDAHREELQERANRADTAFAKLRASNDALTAEINAMKKSEVQSSKATGSSLKQRIKGLEDELAATVKKSQRSTQLLESKLSGLTLTVSRLKEEATQKEAVAEEAAKCALVTSKQRERDLKKKYEALLQSKEEEVVTLSERNAQHEEQHSAELKLLTTQLQRIEALLAKHIPVGAVPPSAPVGSEATPVTKFAAKTNRQTEEDSAQCRADAVEEAAREVTAVLTAKDKQLIECGELITTLRDALAAKDCAFEKEKLVFDASIQESQRELVNMQGASKQALQRQEEALVKSEAQARQLTETIHTLEADLAAAEDALQDERDEGLVSRAEISTLMCHVKTQAEEFAVALQERDRAVEKHVAELSKTQSDITALNNAISELQDQQKRAQSALVDAQEALEAKTSETITIVAALEAAVAGQREQLTNKENELQLKNTALTQMQEEMAAVKKLLSCAEEERDQVRQEKAAREAELEVSRQVQKEGSDLTAQLEQSQEQVKAKDAELITQKKEHMQICSDMEQRLHTTEKALLDAETARDEVVAGLESELRETKRMLTSLESAHDARSQTCAELELQIESFKALSDNPTKKKRSFFSCT